MELKKLKGKIVEDLKMNISVSYRRYDVTNQLFQKALHELKAEKVIWFEIIENSKTPFDGEAKNIKLLDPDYTPD
ncbi:hypothetical protein GGQ84_001038 [Desulfitispora alkaliphila]|uniref:hypothetical protein n=1 Tax=Desulfitispora alkaliphila TaxID=622674 RepID=UPI003D195BAE